jgi:DNA recombination protein RmuC
MMITVLAIAVLLLVAAVVALLLALRADSRPDAAEQAKAAAADAVARLVEQNRELREADRESASASLRAHEAEIKSLAERIRTGQERIEAEVRNRRETDEQTRTLLDQVRQTVVNLNSETAGLKKALRQPQARGKWGELQLRRCVELAGMTEHVDFELQTTMRSEDGVLRPDAVFLMPEGRRVVADSKVPLDAFLEAQEAEDEDERRLQLERHARQAREHIRSLSSKDYQRQFAAGETPDLVVCFIPNEPALHAAFVADPEIFDYAFDRGVLVVSPTSLIGLLRTIELGWRQERMAAEAQQIAETARELHSRFGKFLEAFSTMGKRLASLTNAHNDAVASLEGRLLPQLRRVEELGAGSGKDLDTPAAIEPAVRHISAPELPPVERDAA